MWWNRHRQWLTRTPVGRDLEDLRPNGGYGGQDLVAALGPTAAYRDKGIKGRVGLNSCMIVNGRSTRFLAIDKRNGDHV